MTANEQAAGDATSEMDRDREFEVAAQNEWAELMGMAVEAISECLPGEDLNDLSPIFHMECKRHHFMRLREIRDEMDAALRAAKENR